MNHNHYSERLNQLNLNFEQFLDCLNISGGLFNPLNGFLSENELKHVLEHLCLPDGECWIIPISLDVPEEIYKQKLSYGTLFLKFNQKIFGTLTVTDFFELDQEYYVKKLFGTNDLGHPGVQKELKKTRFRVSGKINITDQNIFSHFDKAIQFRSLFKQAGWETIVGFQTRNPIHRAHEYLQRTVLEIYDGLFINPLTGWKKSGDFSTEAVMVGYEAMIKNYYKGLNVIMRPLKTSMNYAGPKEAIHHAIIRRNMGCTHFMVGRDHAGVMNYYGQYEAHKLIDKLLSRGYKFGITILKMREPVFCHACRHVVTDKSCSHSGSKIEKISGTKIRNLLETGKKPEPHLMREEVSEAIINLGQEKFIL